MPTQNSYYNPAELVDYLARSKRENFTPSFTNKASVLEAEGDKAFAVGIRRTPEGKWEQYQQDKNAKTMQGNPAEELIASQPSTGLPAVDAYNAAGIRRVQVQQQMKALEAQAVQPMNTEIERLAASSSSLGRMLNSVQGDVLRAKYGETYQNSLTTLAESISMRDEVLNQVKFSEEYMALEGTYKELEKAEEQLRTAAALEQSVAQATAAEKARIQVATTEGQKEALEAIPSTTAQYGSLVLGKDEAATKWQIAFEPSTIPSEAKTVIDKATLNELNPHRNTPLANLHTPPAEFEWWATMYHNTFKESDVAGKTAAKALTDQMLTLKNKEELSIDEELNRDIVFKHYTDRMANFTTAASQNSPEYAELATRREQVRKEKIGELFQERYMKQLKNTLFATNQDLLQIPQGTVPADQEVVGEITNFLVESQKPTLEQSVAEMQDVLVPKLIEKGRGLPYINVMLQNVLASYAESINNRHKASGVEINSTDLPTFHQVNFQKYKTYSPSRGY